MPPRKRRAAGPPSGGAAAQRQRRRPSRSPSEEVFDVHSIHDSSGEEAAVTEVTDPRTAKRPRTQRPRPQKARAEDAISISDSEAGSVKGKAMARPKDSPVELSGEEDEDEQVEMKDVEMEDVDINEAAAGNDDNNLAAYVDLHQEEGEGGPTEDNAEQAPSVPIFHDGKGQHRANLSLSLGPAAKPESSKKRENPNAITPRDRAIRLAAHKWHTLALIAHAKARNEWINDEELRDACYALVPNAMVAKLKQIHPKRVVNQRERVRMFESFMAELTRWWAYREFYLDPNMAAGAALRQPNIDIFSSPLPMEGRRVDGWVIESGEEREERWKGERKEREAAAQKAREAVRSKGKGKAAAPPPPAPPAKKLATDITLFAPGKIVKPIYLRLLPAVEPIAGPSDLLKRLEAKRGSRETSAQLFCCLCRALGIPARLVISLQPPPWSVGASKVASTLGAVEPGSVKRVGGRRKKKDAGPAPARKPDDELTSDDEDFEVEGARPRAKGAKSKPSTAAKDDSSELSDVDVIAEDLSPSKPPSNATPNGKTPRRPKGKKKDEDDQEDYRGEKWRGLSAPLQVEHRPKLRMTKPKAAKASELEADELSDVEPIDKDSPPTMWVEVFSKPWQKWITVDPVRGRVEPLGNRGMEPAPSDRSNRLVYVVAFEEDGFARDVTARYTKTLHSRVSKMRPPSSAKARDKGDWWARVVRAIHRPQRLDRDAAEDLELEEAAGREPMPSSVAAFKDHPVYAIEKHLKRDEVIHPPRQIGTFQGIPVFSRSNVVACRSARNWFNEGRVIKDGEQALKFVKARGYTMANRRAEEQARLEGQEAPQEGLYAKYQTELYRAPPVVDGKVPTNAFGNIDLFVPSMLPSGAAHVPYNGAAKVAKKLGISYAEAIVGFEFRKHRSMPKILGVVVPEEHEDVVTEAYWAEEHRAAEREMSRRQERAIKGWKKVINALRIARRVQETYGKGGPDATKEVEEGEEERPKAAGGFFADDAEEEEQRKAQESSGKSRLKMLETDQEALRKKTAAEEEEKRRREEEEEEEEREKAAGEEVSASDVFGGWDVVEESSGRKVTVITSLKDMAAGATGEGEEDEPVVEATPRRTIRLRVPAKSRAEEEVKVNGSTPTRRSARSTRARRSLREASDEG